VAHGQTRATLAKRRAEVAAMFDQVAERYDVLNLLTTLGAERVWRRYVVEAIEPRLGERVLDLAAGTGASSVPLADSGAYTVPADLSLGMLRVGKQRHPDLPFVQGDALALPFPDAAFDAVTMSFGLRNVEDTEAALRELRRVTRPGGRIVICEFSTPTWTPFRAVYHQYLRLLIPAFARLSSDPDAYNYLSESILAWPAQGELADTMAAAGWRNVAWQNLALGVVAIHRGWAQ
jgi:demethylmenaquinone methyltransferase/2-methoxy-6-polyprenyl-1,4-benzoquinol methylase